MLIIPIIMPRSMLFAGIYVIVLCTVGRVLLLQR